MYRLTCPALPLFRRSAKVEWLYYETLTLRRSGGLQQTEPQQAIDSLLQRLLRAAILLLQEAGDVFVYGQGRSHIMMLAP